MSNIGKKVRIKWPGNEYDGQIGEVVKNSCYHEPVVSVKMKDGVLLQPWGPETTHETPQCEWYTEPVNDKWYVRVTGSSAWLEKGEEYPLIENVIDNTDYNSKWWAVTDKRGVRQPVLKDQCTPRYQKQQAMNTDINEQIAVLEKQLNELKEQVNRPYKVGDWIYIINRGCRCGTDETLQNGKVYQIKSVQPYISLSSHSYTLDTDVKIGGNKNDHRLATPEEIAAQIPKEKVVEIGSERTKITVKKGQIVGPDNKTVGISAVENLVSILKSVSAVGNIPWSLSDVSIKIGCAENCKIGQLEQVITAYNSLNG